jgi:hypothetical protein
MLGSRSYFAVLGEAAAFPNGTVVEPYGVDVTVAVKIQR